MRISDWSSDVCSSDLLGGQQRQEGVEGIGQRRAVGDGAAGAALEGNTVDGVADVFYGHDDGFLCALDPDVQTAAMAGAVSLRLDQIGRASCRERVCQYV